MVSLSSVAVALVCFEHFYILVLEMFLWGTDRVNKIFGLKDKDFIEKSRNLAANQGLYNGFLASGLLWSLVHPNPVFANQLAIFFSSCVVVAGIYGGLTVKRRILYVQAFPALVALALQLL
eukprot:TRINITY_DN2199_c0_g1_i2.p1 TRINITY_DN2199_c0_g1~~TRINITY_DN2199_c0_g1_i2.p1  ORF type:complete len:121 (-),score=35.86 TRINITY_DN2199_c0_g1_i2:65-427(-)